MHHDLGAREGLRQARRAKESDALEAKLEPGMLLAALARLEHRVIEPRPPEADIVAAPARDARHRAPHVACAEDGDLHRGTAGAYAPLRGGIVR